MNVDNTTVDVKKRKHPQSILPPSTTQPLQPISLANTRLSLQPLTSLRPSVVSQSVAGGVSGGGGVPSRNLFMSFLLQGAGAMNKPKLKV